MRKILVRSAALSLAVVILALGGIAAYVVLFPQERGLTRDGRMAPPASVRNAPEAPKFDASQPSAPAKTAEQSPADQMPTDLNLPTNLDISAPAVPDGNNAPAGGTRS